MLEKYRIHEFAKDFGVKSTDILALLNRVEEKERTHMAVMTVQELDYLFNHYTKKNQVANFNDYFALVNQPKAEPKPAAPKKEEPKKAEEPKKEEAKKAPEKPKIGLIEKAPAKKPEAPKKQEAPQKAEPKKEEAKKAPEKPKIGLIEKAPARKPAPQKPAVVSQKEFKKGEPVKPVREPKKKEKGPREVQNYERTVRVVDTRTNDVNLGKYDDKLMDLASSHESRNFSSSKQKIQKKKDWQKQGQYGMKKKKETEAERLKRIELQRKQAKMKILVPDEIAVSELALRMKVNVAQVVKKLMGLGILASASQMIDYDTAYLIAEEFDVKVEKEIILSIEDRLIDDREDDAAELQKRCPVVVVMGHVDHGKTSLLDAIRDANVTAGEAGGITQHIGAYKVRLNGEDITFLDTPGHAAFTAMRARGALATDIAILVVAADDGIMPQTVEAINHAKAAEIPIIVAINKMDKPAANPDRVMQELTEHELVPEAWGGDTICVPVSALKHENIDTLLEMVLLVAEMRDLKANPNRLAKGTVIEAKLDKGRGSVATVLVQNGTLNMGDIIIAGTAVGKVRAMTDDKGRKLKSAGPSTPVEIIGLAEVPQAGDNFFVVEDERLARELADQRKNDQKLAAQNQYTVSLDDLFSRIQEGNMKDLNIIVKADVQGSAEAVKASLEKLTNEEVRVRVIHNGVGGINESDVMLAEASGAIIVGFNIRPDANAKASAEKSGVDIRLYRVIYDCIEEIEAAMKGMLAPKFKEVVLGTAEVRQTIKVSGIGTVAGCYVKNGKIVRNASIRLIRDNVVIFEGALASLKRFKDDVKEVLENFECGMTIENYNDLKEGDMIEAFEMQEIKE
ncbi:MAG: translation initiation factor IF-2 [Clostridia bacterium]|nr:translation initiation factor IF-2 [Clostridia bacterium]